MLNYFSYVFGRNSNEEKLAWDGWGVENLGGGDFGIGGVPREGKGVLREAI